MVALHVAFVVLADAFREAKHSGLAGAAVHNCGRTSCTAGLVGFHAMSVFRSACARFILPALRFRI